MAERHKPGNIATEGRAAAPGGGRGKVERFLPTVLAVVLAATAVCLYLPTLDAEFVYDARAQVLRDDYIHDPGNLRQVLTFAVFAQDVLDNNRPVHLLSMMVDSLIWGKDPFGYHLTSILLHGACVAVVFLLALHLLQVGAARQGEAGRGNSPSVLAGAAVAGLLFAVHPVNTEAVCEVSYREDLLAALFVALGLLLAGACARVRGRRSVILAGVAAISFALAAGSKESGIVGPPLVLLYWLLLRRRNANPALKAAVIAGFILVGAVLTARFALAPAESVIFTRKPTYIGGSLAAAIKIQPRIWAFQLSLVAWPNRLCADQTSYAVRHIDLPIALGVLALLIVAAVLVARKNRVFALGAAFYALALLPVSNLHPIYRPIADRYLYLPMIGCAIALAAMLSRVKLSRKSRGGLAVLCVGLAVCAVLAYATAVRQRVWHDGPSLWRDTYHRNPRSSAAANSLGFFALQDAGQAAKAVELFKRAIELSRNTRSGSLAGLAMAYDHLGQTERADRAYRRTAELDHRYKTPAVLARSLIWREDEIRILEKIARRALSPTSSPAPPVQGR